MVIFQNLSKNGEMLNNVGENITKFFAMIFFYTLDIKNIIFNPKFYQHFLPSLVITLAALVHLLRTCQSTLMCVLVVQCDAPSNDPKGSMSMRM